MEDVGSRFARRLREIREEKGLTQEQLAASAGNMSRAFLGALERGEKSPGLMTLDRLARALGVDAADLLRRDDKTPATRRNRTSPEQRLARVVEALAVGASADAIKKFEKMAKTYFSS
jgi:transcriptional regulator with XRE-family HTH domain